MDENDQKPEVKLYHPEPYKKPRAPRGLLSRKEQRMFRKTVKTLEDEGLTGHFDVDLLAEYCQLSTQENALYIKLNEIDEKRKTAAKPAVALLWRVKVGLNSPYF